VLVSVLAARLLSGGLLGGLDSGWRV